VVGGVFQKFPDHAHRDQVQCGIRLVQAGDGSATSEQAHQRDLAAAASREHEQLFAQMRLQLQGVNQIGLQARIPEEVLRLQVGPDGFGSVVIVLG